MLNLSDELLSKVKETKSVEELLVLAKENNLELTEDEAKVYFAGLNLKKGELSDEELDQVSGGLYNSDGSLQVTIYYKCKYYEPDESRNASHYVRCPNCKWVEKVGFDFFSGCYHPAMMGEPRE
jgi:hypothetical protein